MSKTKESKREKKRRFVEMYIKLLTTSRMSHATGMDFSVGKIN